MVTTPGWINFQGGGRDTSECVDPCLGCDGGPGDPGGPGGGGGGGGGCEPFIFSVRSDSAIAQCNIEFPGLEAFCEDYNEAFRFGLNATGAGHAMPAIWETPAIWITPRGTVGCNSNCPGIMTQEMRWDVPYFAITPGNVTPNLTPATFSTMFGTPNEGGGLPFMDCTVRTGSSYMSSMVAEYAGETNTGISGVAMLTDDGTNPTITGWGILIDRTDNTVKFVQWSGALLENYTVLDSAAYVPAISPSFDQLVVTAEMRCLCPHVGMPQYPSVGRIIAQVIGNTDINFATADGTITEAEWAQLLYGALVVPPVENDEELNVVLYRNVTVVPLFHITENCTP